MEFELNEEQLQMKMSVREFAEGEIAPHVMEWDEAQHFPVELQPKLAELGLLGILFPEEYGGAGLARGEHLGAWGLTEPGAGSDASGTRTTAVKNNGGWVVNGSKNFITHAIHADTCVAVAVTDRSKRSKGISAFIFEKGMKGFSPSKKENKLGL